MMKNLNPSVYTKERNRKQLSRLAAWLTVAGALVAGPALATSYVMVSDEGLTDFSHYIVYGRVLGSRPASVGPYTTYDVEIERNLKGWTGPEVVPVQVLGSNGENGPGLHVFGAPRFTAGETVLLFLRHDEARYRITHMMLGAFHVIDNQSQSFAARYLGDTEAVSAADLAESDVSASAAGIVRDPGRFMAWIADRVAGVERQADYFVESSQSGLDFYWNEFTLLSNPPSRWFQFDTGRAVKFKKNGGSLGGVPNLTRRYKNAINALNQATSKSVINYRLKGRTSSNAGFNFSDGVNSVNNRDVSSSLPAFDCARGGVLAAAGYWLSPNTRKFRGRTYRRTPEADFLWNDGLKCFFDRSPNAAKAAEEIAAHEFGHTLGMGHSCGDASSGPCNRRVRDEALMRAFVHNDRRGAKLNKDDRNGLINSRKGMQYRN